MRLNVHLVLKLYQSGSDPAELVLLEILSGAGGVLIFDVGLGDVAASLSSCFNELHFH